MYLKKIICENMGPISVADITPGFHPDGNPKPLVIVGKNGTGKSILISNIVDSFFEFGNQAYGDIAMKSGLSNLYFKVASNNQIQIGKKSMICRLEYSSGDNCITPFYTYYQDEFAKKSSTKEPNDIIHYNSHYGAKSVNRNKEKDFTANKSLFQKEFDSNVFIFFPPERFFIPYWMGKAYSSSPDYGSVNLQDKINNELCRPIIACNPTDENTRWIIDVLIDTKADIVLGPGTNIHTLLDVPSLVLLEKSKTSIEKVLSCIMGKDILLRLNLRNAGKSRVNIISAPENRRIAPTVDALSTGQLILLNIFLTIIRYAEKSNPYNTISLEEIKGIVVIDEIELHLHSDLQGSVLPRLIQLFPKVQFIITSHSPLFLLGMQHEFTDDGFDIFEMPNGNKINAESFSEFKNAYATIAETQTFQNEMENIIKSYKGKEKKALIITEGPSDWKHMKRAWKKLRNSSKYAPLIDKFEFLEYEPSNSTCLEKFKMDMGYAKLRKFLEFLLEFPNDRKIIFIADRDVPDIVTKFTDNGRFKHHYQGEMDTNVFSFVIPVPTHRSQDNICIEHYYTDNEIRTQQNGRHLFLGKDFNDSGFGQGPYSDYFCHAPGLCGSNRDSIIDASVRVTLLSLQGNGNNYALSKNSFAEAILNEEGDFANISSESFSLIFDVLLEIIAPESIQSTVTTTPAGEGSETPQQATP